jgi:putative redox protein
LGDHISHPSTAITPGARAIRSEEISFLGGDGENWLAARLDSPPTPPVAYAIFAHCFTCTHDMYAMSEIAKGLTGNGIAVFRFDFTGLGGSEGEFSETNFTSNVHDLLAAANWLRTNKQAPRVLIGHSLGGTAILAAAARIPESRAVCTIASPAEPTYMLDVMEDHIPEIEAEGEAEVSIVGRPFRIQKQFLDDLGTHSMAEVIAGLGRALLILHAPGDDFVHIDNAQAIFAVAEHPKSFVSLDNADHLLTRAADATYVADVIASWAKRYIAEKR